MPVKRRLAKERQGDLSPVAWALLNDEPLPATAPGSPQAWEAFHLRRPGEEVGGRPTLRGLWSIYGKGVTHDWADEHPGTRPSCWWRWSAPRQPLGTHPGCHYDGELPLPRQRCGGIGSPAFEVLAYLPSYHLGIPDRWLTRADADRLRSLEGFRGFPILPSDPPRFEAQASYLDRHGLLLRGERERVPADGWRPVVVAPTE